MTGNENGEGFGSGWDGRGVDGVHPDRWEMRRGVNYVAGRRRADEAAVRLGAALSVNVPGAVRGVHADVAADGTGVVWLAFEVETAERIAAILDDGRGGLRAVGGDAA